MALAQRQAQAYAIAQGLQVNTGTAVTHPHFMCWAGKVPGVLLCTMLDRWIEADFPSLG